MESVYSFSNDERSVFIDLSVVSNAKSEEEQNVIAQDILESQVQNPEEFYLDDVQDIKQK